MPINFQIDWTDDNEERSEYFCSKRCMVAALEDAMVGPDLDDGYYGDRDIRDGVEWYRDPYSVDTDDDIRCGTCDQHLQHGTLCYPLSGGSLDCMAG